MDDDAFAKLEAFLLDIPAVEGWIGKGGENSLWWVKFGIDINHPRAWQVVQYLGHVLNYVSLEERLPTLFMPVSPPPYVNGGPTEFLSWVIEGKDEEFLPDHCAEWLEARLPQPVDDESQWQADLEDDEDDEQED
jgi:hypothetical protein